MGRHAVICVCRRGPPQPHTVDWPSGRASRPGSIRLAVIAAVRHPLVVAAWYCWTTLAGMRPRSLTTMPWALAHARMLSLRWRLSVVRIGRRRGSRPALRACSMKGASSRRNARTCRLLRSISYCDPLHSNRTVSSAARRPDRLHPALLDGDRLFAPYKISRHGRGNRNAVGRQGALVDAGTRRPMQAGLRPGSRSGTGPLSCAGLSPGVKAASAAASPGAVPIGLTETHWSHPKRPAGEWPTVSGSDSNAVGPAVFRGPGERWAGQRVVVGHHGRPSGQAG